MSGVSKASTAVKCSVVGALTGAVGTRGTCLAVYPSVYHGSADAATAKPPVAKPATAAAPHPKSTVTAKKHKSAKAGASLDDWIGIGTMVVG